MTAKVSKFDTTCRTIFLHMGTSLGDIFMALVLSFWRVYTKEDLNNLLRGTLSNGRRAKPEIAATQRMFVMSLLSITALLWSWELFSASEKYKILKSATKFI